jgi:hypothetical protein
MWSARLPLFPEIEIPPLAASDFRLEGAPVH